jgi:hypothetical protein
MKLANAYLDKDVTTSRAVIGTSEAGRGRTDLNTQSYVGELSYAFNLSRLNHSADLTLQFVIPISNKMVIRKILLHQ